MTRDTHLPWCGQGTCMSSPPFPTETFALLLSLRKGRTAEEECEFGERRTEKYLFWNTNIAFLVAEAKGILSDAASSSPVATKVTLPSHPWVQTETNHLCSFQPMGCGRERTTLSGLPCKPPAMYSTHSLLWWMLVLPNWKKSWPLELVAKGTLQNCCLTHETRCRQRMNFYCAKQLSLEGGVSCWHLLSRWTYYRHNYLKHSFKLKCSNIW